MPKISVIVPVYGVEKYIERCARSLFEQTLDDIEYIFVDDCTPDKSIEILEKVLDDYPVRKPQVKIIRLKQNSGQAAVRKCGTVNATGDYLIHCDSDDWVDVTMYEKMYTKAIETDADMVWCDYYRVRDGKKELKSQKCECDILTVAKSFFDSTLIASLCNRLYKRRLHRADFIYPVEDMHEDFVYALQLLLNSEKIEYLNSALYYYRFNPISISQLCDEKGTIKRYRGAIANTDILILILEKNNLTTQLSNQIEYKKFLCKNTLSPILGKKEYRKLFCDTYSEINKTYLRNPYISTNGKLRAFCILHGMYKTYLFFMWLKSFMTK